LTPVTYSVAAQAVVDTYNGRPDDQKSGAYWSNEEVTAVRKEIKDHYIQEQSHRCAYCRHAIYTNNNAVWDAEHIISKANNPKFMFEPRNLAVACKDCNGAKSEQEVRSTPKVSFPSTSEDYLIVHPHFDDYGAHIGWIGELCFARTRGKGTKTIAMCNLSRYSAMTVGEDSNIMDDRFNKLVATLFDAKTPVDAAMVAAAIAEFLKSKIK
jgi:hypothetical protein